jgi:hypothetical protein
MTNELQNQICPQNPDSPSTCPKCGSNALYKKELAEDQLEVMCLANGCTHIWTAPGRIQYPSDPLHPFARRIESLEEDQLKSLAENLENACQTLTGRSARLAQRQLALLNIELQKRVPPPQPEPAEKKRVSSPNPQKAPPQFKTQKACINRVKGIREHYQQKKNRTLSASPDSVPPPNRWFDALIKTLQDEAARHEQAANHYSRDPNLSVLHIEHTARAFELKRVIDMLANHIKIVFPENP